jgi:MraZ protein
MDDKGRVSIPARFRETLGGLQDERLVLSPFEDRGTVGLEVFPYSVWRENEKKLRENHRYDRTTLDYIYRSVGLAADCTPDAQGRILVPPDLRSEGRLGRDIAFSGHIDSFRMWDAETWRAVLKKAREVYAEPTELLKLTV